MLIFICQLFLFWIEIYYLFNTVVIRQCKPYVVCVYPGRAPCRVTRRRTLCSWSRACSSCCVFPSASPATRRWRTFCSSWLCPDLGSSCSSLQGNTPLSMPFTLCQRPCIRGHEKLWMFVSLSVPRMLIYGFFIFQNILTLKCLSVGIKYLWWGLPM